MCPHHIHTRINPYLTRRPDAMSKALASHSIPYTVFSCDLFQVWNDLTFAHHLGHQFGGRWTHLFLWGFQGPDSHDADATLNISQASPMGLTLPCMGVQDFRIPMVNYRPCLQPYNQSMVIPWVSKDHRSSFLRKHSICL
jgi:hypothetical protein